MNDRERFRLLDDYRTPRFQYGQVVMDEIRGWVRIAGLSDAPIPWPIGKRGRQRFLIVYRGLSRAVQCESNQAVARAWGVTPQTVTKWRKGLSVRRVNDGTKRLMRLRALTPEFRETVQAKARAKDQDPVRREKIAASKRGKPRSEMTRLLMRWANLGRCPTEQARRNMSAAHKRRGTRPPAAGRPWTEEEDLAVLSLRPMEAAKKTGRTLTAVYARRLILQMPDGRGSTARRLELQATYHARMQGQKPRNGS